MWCASSAACGVAMARDPQRDELLDQLTRKSARRERARSEGRHGLHFGLGMFGVIGWSVAVPTILGIALGVYLDARSGQRYSWTLMLMFGGMLLGVANAWWWIERKGLGKR
jgi:ATP synthase protein I